MSKSPTDPRAFYLKLLLSRSETKDPGGVNQSCIVRDQNIDNFILTVGLNPLNEATPEPLTTIVFQFLLIITSCSLLKFDMVMISLLF